MHRNNATANFDIKQIFLDSCVLMLAYLVSHRLYALFQGEVLGQDHFWIYILFTVIFVLAMMIMRMYNITTFYYLNRIVQRVFVATGISGLCISAVIFLSKTVTASRLFFLLFCVLSGTFVLLERCAIRWMLREHVGNGYTHVLFVGDSGSLRKYSDFIAKTAMKVKIDKHLSPDNPVLAYPEAFESLLKSLSINEVLYVYTGVDSMPHLTDMMAVCEDMGLTARLLLDMFDLPNSKHFVSSIGTYPVLTYHSISFNKLALFCKAAIDTVGALFGLIVLSPVFLLTAAAIKLESPGPALFTQTRIGKNGKPFKMYKFRSMYRDAEERKKELMAQNQVKGGYMFKMDNDPRITKVGAFIRKTSIDELPQLVNVLMQNMSLVGTRPPTPDEVARYSRNHWRRISIKPGITGMWQTCGRSDILDFDEVVALDKKYIDEWSLSLDAKIIIKTFTAVLSRRGAR